MTRINITDDMIERAAKAADREVAAASAYARDTDTWMCWNNEKIARVALEAALDRRTGPKDRRVEWDDDEGMARRHSWHTCGRRHDDKPYYRLPSKSDRLKREAEAKAQEIHVSDGMKDVGLEILLQNIGVDRDTPTAVIAKAVATIYRAMRLQEMKERGQ